MKGYGLALCSVILVTAAQLMLRWSMMRLPGVEILAEWRSVSPRPLLVLCGGLTAYGFSMLCWLLALRRLPLSRAYPVLSLSYALVWMLAVLLPAFAEPFHPGALAGVALILLGLLCMCARPGKPDSRRNAAENDATR
ncbi:4-amino-4-deoxy-L-arabinose-phospho-UDP flippase [Brenneria izadpanahii]|uniref:Probable 4-amino-4-deoxy-L-arabinose-phosphoundecaprenol flippase subunit ArnF n=1 Tax=Brenneria izadpanahii TaxID=2722756 RepID=A0ABX7UZD2_9GAMM|nr:4-amino-4-deoxy-L-arabinose-phosphoundecaprenol flippase subunit ArnF [Brenneria izadpanahii]QTF09712.1 4-amino-4-deoxy-L-arabinose-phospho-UDP flippase [Brenneria izadpanahii]